jgi:hypothetical protein
MARATPKALLPAHGGLIADPAECLTRYVAHRRMREARVLDALSRQREPVLVGDLLPDAYADAPRAVWPLAEMSLEAHLLKLERDGRAMRREGRWVEAQGR